MLLEPSAKAVEDPLYHIVIVKWCGSVASHFRPSLFMVFLGGFLFIFLELLHGTCLVKTSPPLGALFVRKRVQALLHEM